MLRDRRGGHSHAFVIARLGHFQNFYDLPPDLAVAGRFRARAHGLHEIQDLRLQGFRVPDQGTDNIAIAEHQPLRRQPIGVVLFLEGGGVLKI